MIDLHFFRTFSFSENFCGKMSYVAQVLARSIESREYSYQIRKTEIANTLTVCIIHGFAFLPAFSCRGERRVG